MVVGLEGRLAARRPRTRGWRKTEFRKARALVPFPALCLESIPVSTARCYLSIVTSKLLLSLSVALIAVACVPKKTAAPSPGKDASGVTARCDPFAGASEGPYKYENNTWGSDKAKGAWEQCLLERERDGKKEYGWTWNFPGFDPSVFSYPEIIFGWKPWSGGPTTDARFPMKVADVKKLAMHYEVETEATGNYNLAPEVWLTRSKGFGEPNPKLLTAEIMFWVETAGQARPAGNVIDKPTIGGVTYELWKMDGAAGDGKSGTSWALFSLKSLTTQRKGSIPVDAVLKYMADAKLIDSEHWVSSIEFGNEVSGGTGTTWVKRFAIEVGQ
jgi:hypothetical protein